MLRTIGFLLGGSGILTAGLLSHVTELCVIGGILVGLGVFDCGLGLYNSFRKQPLPSVSPTVDP
jgi:hypothetical protein